MMSVIDLLLNVFLLLLVEKMNLCLQLFSLLIKLVEIESGSWRRLSLCL